MSGLSTSVDKLSTEESLPLDDADSQAAVDKRVKEILAARGKRYGVKSSRAQIIEAEEPRKKFKATKVKYIRDGRDKQVVLAKPSDMAQGILNHRRRQLLLDRHSFFLPVYDLNAQMMLLKCGRQVAKSTTLCNLILIEMMTYDAFRILYVSPSSMQTRQFSNEKLSPTMHDTEFIQDHFIDGEVVDQVFEKQLTNGSHLFLRYAFLTADRARGIPADRLMIDEIQDILKDNVKVIAECLSFSDYALELYSGTPKTFDNTIEEYWGWSTQNEWAIPCDCGGGHSGGKYWQIVSIDNIGKEGLVCRKCDRPIHPERGQWIIGDKTGEYIGFHVTQLMVSWKQDTERWRKEIIFKLENWPEAVFYNEVLGESRDQASKPITQSAIQECCYPINKVDRIPSEHFIADRHPEISSHLCYAGIDWGEGRSEGKVESGKKRHASFTVLTIGCFVREDVFWPFFIKRYEGREIDPEFIKEDILNWCGLFNVAMIGVDWGHGWGMNSHLVRNYGREHVMEFLYVARLKSRYKWDSEAFNFKINRSLAISEFLDACKRQKMLFPVWEETKEFAKDILGIYIDYNERMKTMYYDHPIDQPDDAMHSIIYARIAGMMAESRY